MPRNLRIEYPGAIYHVMNRGNQRRDIFRDDQDRLQFLGTLGEACAKTGWQVHAYCLMPNHFHLVIETPRGELAMDRRPVAHGKLELPAQPPCIQKEVCETEFPMDHSENQQ